MPGDADAAAPAAAAEAVRVATEQRIREESRYPPTDLTARP